jgi:hypothetical protein
MNRLLLCALVSAVATIPADRHSAAAVQQQPPRLGPTNAELERRDQAVTADDVRILARAAELLKNESMWNRADDRECTDDEATGKRSLFCALQKACIDVLGSYDHRRVALCPPLGSPMSGPFCRWLSIA